MIDRMMRKHVHHRHSAEWQQIALLDLLSWVLQYSFEVCVEADHDSCPEIMLTVNGGLRFAS